MKCSVSVVGAGTVGLTVAWSLARAGSAVTVFDPAPGSGASWVAGGMIAPYSEAWPGEAPLLALGVESLELWDAFAQALQPYADGPLVTARGTVWLGVDDGDAADLATVAAAVAEAGLDPHRFEAIRPSVALRAVPGAAPRIRAAAQAPAEFAVDNRLVHSALLAACADAGVEFRREAVADPVGVPGDAVIVCAGSASAALLPELGVRPVKGEVVRLRRGPHCLPPPTVTVRARVHGRQVYVVPRADGVVVGATQYENDRDLAPRIGPVVDLLDDAFAVLPFLREYELLEVIAGLRPVTADNVPVIRPVDTSGGGRVFAATGHGRNGILLAPVTGAKVVDMVLNQEVHAWS